MPDHAEGREARSQALLAFGDDLKRAGAFSIDPPTPKNARLGAPFSIAMGLLPFPFTASCDAAGIAADVADSSDPRSAHENTGLPLSRAAHGNRTALACLVSRELV